MYTMRPVGSDLEKGLYEFVDSIPDKSTIAEIGCYSGESSLILLRKAKKLYCIDRWKDYVEHNSGGRIESYNMHEVEREFNKRTFDARVRKEIVKIKSWSKDAVKLFGNESLDVVYIDANHEYKYVKQDIELWRPKVKPGGIIAVHDFAQPYADVCEAFLELLGKPNKVYPDTTAVRFMWANIGEQNDSDRTA